jgi:hypothetical protein
VGLQRKRGESREILTQNLAKLWEKYGKMAHLQMMYLLDMMIFSSYVKQSEGTLTAAVVQDLLWMNRLAFGR